jgi:hypothetical protein
MISSRQKGIVLLIPAPRGRQKGLDWSLNKTFAIMFDQLFQSLNPVLKHALNLFESDAVLDVCQYVDQRICIRVSKYPISQCCLGPFERPEVAPAEIKRIR